MENKDLPAAVGPNGRWFGTESGASVADLTHWFCNFQNSNPIAVIPGRAPISGLPEIGTCMSKSAKADLEWARARNP